MILDQRIEIAAMVVDNRVISIEDGFGFEWEINNIINKKLEENRSKYGALGDPIPDISWS